MGYLFFSTQGWDEMGGAGRPTHYLAREALARGNRVMYVQATPTTASQKEPKLTVLSFADLGFTERELRRAWSGLNPGNLEKFSAAFARELDAFETAPGEAAVAVIADAFVPFAMLIPELRQHEFRTVYQALDDFEALEGLGYYFENTAAEKFLVEHCDLTVAVSQVLLEKLTANFPGANIRFLRQGYNPNEFNLDIQDAKQLSTDLVRGNCTLGFWGLVNDFNVDVELLTYISQARPAWAINLIGPVDTDPARRAVGGALRALPNVHLLGQKPHASLHNYLQGFDVALILYPHNKFNLARDPLKVYEYLAGHKPVVAAHMPGLTEMPYVYSADSPSEFLGCIEAALRTPIDSARVDSYLAHCTWAARFDQLCALLAQALRREELLSAQDPESFYDSDNIPARARQYIVQTEQLLDERTAYIEQLTQESAETQKYVGRLERTHPGLRLKRLMGRK